MPFLQLAGLPLYYELHGPEDSERPLVVFFNGWLLSARYWQETVGRLEKQHPLLLFDSRGFGRSRPSGPVHASYHANIDSGADEILLLLEKLNLAGRRYHVVGHSLGAVTATHFAALAEERGQLASLTIINSGSFDDNEPQGSRLVTFVKFFVKIKGFLNLPLVRVGVIGRSVARPIPGRYALNITEDFALADERLALEISLSSLEAKMLARYRNELKQVKAPLLLVVGDRDATIPPKGMYNIKQFKPEARLVAFSDCGHLPMLERPDDFCRKLASHFEQAELSNFSNESVEVKK